MGTTGTWIAPVAAFALLVETVAIPAAATGADAGDATAIDNAGPPAGLLGPVPGAVGRVSVATGQVG
jgi:hypothetical protein